MGQVKSTQSNPSYDDYPKAEGVKVEQSVLNLNERIQRLTESINKPEVTALDLSYVKTHFDKEFKSIKASIGDKSLQANLLKLKDKIGEKFNDSESHELIFHIQCTAQTMSFDTTFEKIPSLQSLNLTDCGQPLEEKLVEAHEKMSNLHNLDLSHLQDNRALSFKLIQAVSDNDTKTVKLLLTQENIDVNFQDDRGNTALMYGVNRRNIEITRLLLAKENIDPNLQNKIGNTALIFAAIGQTKILVEMLIAKENIKLNLQDMLGRTAKMYASVFGDKEIVEILSNAITREDLNIQKEMSKLIILAHSTNVGGKSHVVTNTGDRYQHFNLEGINYPYLLKKMSQALEHFSQFPLKSVNLNESSQLSNIFKCTVNNSNQEILDRIGKGLPVLLITGYAGHSVSVLIWAPYFTLCNRGEGNRGSVVEVFKCDLKKIDNQVLNKIRNTLNQDAEAYRKLFFEELPNKLSFTLKGKSELTLQSICSSNLTEQLYGNCSWAAPEGSIFTFFLLNTIFADMNGSSTLDPSSKMALIMPFGLEIQQIRDKFNEWLVVTQMYELERYLGVEALRTLSHEKISRNAERRRVIEIDYSVLVSSLQSILSKVSMLPNPDDMKNHLKSILVNTLALTTSGEEDQRLKTAQEILGSIQTITPDEMKAKFNQSG